jgi:hypothetical protein
MINIVTEETEIPFHKIEKEEGAEITDVRNIVNGRSARVHPDSLAIQWLESFKLPGKCIKQFETQNGLTGLSISASMWTEMAC